MRIIDKTPFQDEAGNISPLGRIQGTLTYGFNWYAEVQAQKDVLTQLDKLLEKGFVAIHNFKLPEIEAIIPIILIGTGSIHVIFVTPDKGHFEAKGGEWNTLINNGSPAPARRNLVDLTYKLSRAFIKYLEKQKINTEVQVEPLLIASNPGAQVDSLRPIVRVLRSDAISNFANSLLQEKSILRSDVIYDLADRILEPKPAQDESASPANLTAASRAQAENNPQEGVPAQLIESSPARHLPQPKTKQSRGMSKSQIILLAAMFIIECCVLAAGAAVLFYF